MATTKTLLDLIVDGARRETLPYRQPNRWRQNFATGDMPYTACELATDGFRLAVQRVDSAPDEPMSLYGSTPPRVLAIWPKVSTLPNEIRIPADAAHTIGALAKVQDALAPKGKKARNARAVAADFEIHPESASGYEKATLTISAAHACVKATLYGVTMTGGPIHFNLTYLWQALDSTYGSLVRFDNATRPALITSSDNAPTGSIVSLLMPVSRE